MKAGAVATEAKYLSHHRGGAPKQGFTMANSEASLTSYYCDDVTRAAIEVME